MHTAMDSAIFRFIHTAIHRFTHRAIPRTIHTAIHMTIHTAIHTLIRACIPMPKCTAICSAKHAYIFAEPLGWGATGAHAPAAGARVVPQALQARAFAPRCGVNDWHVVPHLPYGIIPHRSP